MSDMGDTFNAMKASNRQRRADNREQSAALLRKAGIVFSDRNLGAHLIVEGPRGYIDFWPGTGRWHERGGKKGFGVGALIEHIKGNTYGNGPP